MNKSVVFFINSLRGGGAEKICITLANEFYNKGINVKIVVLNLNNAINKSELNSKVELINLNVSNTKYSFHKIFKFLKKEKPSKVMAFNPYLAILLIFYKLIFKRDLKVIVRNITSLNKLRNEMKSFWHKHIMFNFLKLLYKKADKIITQSNGVHLELINSLKVKKEKIVTIHNPISKKIESYSTKYNTESQKENYILFIGRLDAPKGLYYLIDAFKLFNNKFPDVKLKILGEGPLQEELELYIKTKNLTKNIIFKGFISEYFSYYKKARFTVLSSIREGFPNVLIESIALGTPIVSFNTPDGPSEIIIDNENGFLAEYLSTKDLGNCMIKAYSTNFNYTTVVNSSKKFKTDLIIHKYIQEIILND